MIKKLYPEVLFCMLLLLLPAKSILAQSDKPFDFTGSWKITNHSIVDHETPATLTDESSLWTNLILKGEVMVVGKDGRVTFKMQENPITATFEIKDGKLIMTFYSGVGKKGGEPVQGSVSTTAYDITFSGGGFTISHDDPSVTESYTFTKAN